MAALHQVWKSRLAALACAVAVGLAPWVAAAQQRLPGQDAPALALAVEAWLADDEETALGGLAALANADNAAAQVLLALIDKTPALQGVWLARQPRADRIALMRDVGGMSGRSWMHRAASQAGLAGLWLQLWRVEARPDLVAAFQQAGENRAARETVLALWARQHPGLSGLADTPGFPEAMRVVFWLGAGPGSDAADLAALAPGHPAREMLGQAVAPDDLADWLLSDPLAAPLAGLCRDACRASAGACSRAGFAALGGYMTLASFGSPSATLIPEEVFQTSPRGRSALLRRALLNADARGRRIMFARARDTDACFADLLEAEADRYKPQRD